MNANAATTLPGTLEFGGRKVLLKYHKLSSGRGRNPPNSVAALAEVVAGGAAAIELDANPMADGGYALLHDDRLESETDGTGSVRETSADELKKLSLRQGPGVPATLADVTESLHSHSQPLKLQVDLKSIEPLDTSAAKGLLRALEPLRENAHLRIVVGCMADWNLRLLQRLDASLHVGFDPGFYLHAPDPGWLIPLPTRVNAYGYMDDHPLGYRRVLPAARYLEDRMEVLVSQLPAAVEFYLHKAFVAKALSDGFNPIDAIHRLLPHSLVDVWTLNSSQPGVEEQLHLMLSAGADQVTTDTPVELQRLSSRVGFDRKSR